MISYPKKADYVVSIKTLKNIKKSLGGLVMSVCGSGNFFKNTLQLPELLIGFWHELQEKVVERSVMSVRLSFSVAVMPQICACTVLL